MSGCVDPSFLSRISVKFSDHFFGKILVCDDCPTLTNQEQCGQLGDGICNQELMNAISCFDLGDCWCQLCNDKDLNLRVGNSVNSTRLF